MHQIISPPLDITSVPLIWRNDVEGNNLLDYCAQEPIYKKIFIIIAKSCLPKK